MSADIRGNIGGLGDSPQPDDLERDGEAIRADMNRTLDELERKFSPGQMLDRSLDYLREHGGDMAHKVGDTVRQNPLPVLMTAAGLLWMLASSYRSGSERNPRQVRYPGIVPESGLQKVKGRVSMASERLRSTSHLAADRARSAKQATTTTVSSALRSTREQTRRARDGFQVMMDEQPIVVGAMGVAVGALLGAALPTTEWENRTLGRARDTALEKAKQLGAEKYEGMREVIRGEANQSTSSGSLEGASPEKYSSEKSNPGKSNPGKSSSGTSASGQYTGQA